ncbi:MAG: metal ABC transporter permease [Anaerolineales bacterium]|nr:metal ABC transporter permease [Anaerolineales bacterium]
MSSAQIEIQLIGLVVAAACALPGVFLVLRGMAMMSDAISHTVLLGIVLGFMVLGDLESPWLIIAAAAMGLITVSLIELLNNTKLVKQDAAIGLVFPALFSLAVILISRFARGVHLDNDAVLLGELAFAPFNRILLFGVSLPHSLVVMGVILLVNIAFIALFYKELKLATFDAGLAMALGFSPALIHYGLMALVSVTAVGAFDAVGSIMVVAFMVAPGAAAYLLTDRLDRMLLYAVLIGAAGTLGGYWMAHWLDANIAGSMSTIIGLLFVLCLLFAPRRGLLAIAARRRRQKWEFAQTMLAIHLLHHEGTAEAGVENRLEHLHDHLRWEPGFARGVVRRAREGGLISQSNGSLLLTAQGRQLAEQNLEG